MLYAARKNTKMLIMSALVMAMPALATAAVKVDKEITFHPTTITIGGPGIVDNLPPGRLAIIYRAAQTLPRNLCVTLHCRKGSGRAELVKVASAGGGTMFEKHPMTT